MKQIDQSFGKLIFKETILYVSFIPDFEITPEVIESIHKKGLEHFKDEPYAIIVDFKNNISSTPEARVFGSKNKYMHQHIAYGMVASSLAEKLLVNFFITFNKPKVPSRLFTTIESCETWIKTKISLKLVNQSQV
jgi:hypothetical protein